MPLTTDQIQLAGEASMLRDSEQGQPRWFCPSDDLFAAAARLWAGGWLDRKWQDGDLVYRWSDRGTTALNTNELLHAHDDREN